MFFPFFLPLPQKPSNKKWYCHQNPHLDQEEKIVWDDDQAPSIREWRSAVFACLGDLGTIYTIPTLVEQILPQ